MDKDTKKALDDKYGVPDDVEEFAAKIADKQDNPTIHELAKKFPEKTYRELETYRDYKELEKYRNADRQEEAGQIPLTDAQKNLVDHIESAVQQNKEGRCVVGEMRKDREEKPTKVNLDYRNSLEDAAKASQPAWESEVSALKQQLHTDREEFQSSLDQVKKENNELFNRIAELTEIDESHQRLNGKLQVRIAELEDENKKVHDDLDKKLESARKAGM